MYIQEISLEINSNVDKNEIVDEFGILMSHYRGNGQIQGNIQTEYIFGNKLIGLPYTLEKNSLDAKFNNFYVNKQTEKIEELCTSKIHINTVGKSYDTYISPCICKKIDFYILITNYITIESPISCGTCNHSVPLYRIPKYHDHGYMPILSWETNYISCDSLQMNCEVGERWALNQMQNFNSTLTKQGLKICQALETSTGTPTYYYLHNYRKNKAGFQMNLCPNCNHSWALKSRLHNFYDFKCDHCRLVSTISMNS